MMPVCIGGMHRSGMSLVARLLASAGLSISPPSDSVDGGPFTQVNEALLAEVGGGWDLPPIVPEGWEKWGQLAALRQQATAAVNSLHGQSAWGWSDPCNCLTFPFWRALLPGVKVIVCLRNPLEMARSLHACTRASVASAMNLWMSYNQRLLAEARPEDRIITHYESYLHEPAAELRRVLDGLEMPASDEVIAQACAGVSPSLRHHQATLRELLSAEAPADVVGLYIAMCQEAGPVWAAAIGSGAEGQVLPDVFALLSEASSHERRRQVTIESRLVRKERAVEELGARLEEQQRVLKALTAQTAGQDHAVTRLTDLLTAKEQSVQDLTHDLSEKERQLGGLAEQMRWKQEMIDGLARRLAGVEGALAERQREVQGLTSRLTAITQSKSWRLMMGMGQIVYWRRWREARKQDAAAGAPVGGVADPTIRAASTTPPTGAVGGVVDPASSSMGGVNDPITASTTPSTVDPVTTSTTSSTAGPGVFPEQSGKSVLFITLDSCRYDTFEAAATPNLKAVGPLYRAMAPGNFTYSSHMAMFMGFTPGDAMRRERFINPKYGKLFKMIGAGYPSKGTEHFTLHGRNIIDGFKRLGYLTLGAGAMAWFNPAAETGRVLSQDFERFFFEGHSSLPQQMQWIGQNLPMDRRPAFVFLNVGETHVPYHYEGAPWDRRSNPCKPFSDSNDAAECRRRQTACVEYVDAMLAPLLGAFAQSTILVCADHGDCWGEDGLWEHSIHHPKVMEVPLMFRTGVRG